MRHSLRPNPDDYLSLLAQQAEMGDTKALLQLLKEAVRRNDDRYLYEVVLEIATGLKFQAEDEARLQRKNRYDSDPNYLYMKALVGLIANAYWWIRWSRDGSEYADLKINKLLDGEYDNPPRN